MSSAHGQSQYQVRFDWGVPGADAVAGGADVVVVVDVLSFSTTVELVTTHGVDVLPSAPEHAAELATARSAIVASDRGDGPSLSPASITAESLSGISRFVLPSLNGSRLVSSMDGRGATIVAGCLRNAAAVAGWALKQQGDKGDRFVVAVIGAGEERDDGSLRFALEDLLGAGAIVDALAAVGIDYCSPEAAAAASAFTGLRNATGHLIGASASGRELAERGFRNDIDLAIEVNASDTVPVLGEFGFRAER